MTCWWRTYLSSSVLSSTLRGRQLSTTFPMVAHVGLGGFTLAHAVLVGTGNLRVNGVLLG